MPKIINAFQGTSPVADSISKLGLALFGDNLSTDLKRAQLEALQRENTETTNLGLDVEGAGGASAAFRNPTTQGRLLSSGVKPQDFIDLSRADAYVSGDPVADAFYQGAGGARSGTTAGFNQDQSRQERQHGATLGETTRHNLAGEGLDQDKFGWEKDKFFQEPQAALVNGQPGYVPRGRLTDSGTAPILSESDRKGTLIDNQFYNLTPEEQKAVIGAEPKTETPRNYVAGDQRFITYDGRLDAQTGQPLPPGGYIANAEGTAEGVGLTNAAQTDAQSKILGGNAFLAQADAMIKLADEHPESFGIIGASRNAAQEINQSWQVLSKYLGYSPDLLARQAKANGFDVSEYDRSLPQVQALSTTMAYSAASAVAGQENRSVSDTDRKIWAKAIGDAQSFLSLDTAQSVKERALFFKAVVQENQRLSQGALDQGYKFSPDGSNSMLQQAIANVMANPNSFTAGPAQAVPGVSPAAPTETTAPVDWRTYFGGQ